MSSKRRCRSGPIRPLKTCSAKEARKDPWDGRNEPSRVSDKRLHVSAASGSCSREAVPLTEAPRGTRLGAQSARTLEPSLSAELFSHKTTSEDGLYMGDRLRLRGAAASRKSRRQQERNMAARTRGECRSYLGVLAEPAACGCKARRRGTAFNGMAVHHVQEVLRAAQAGRRTFAPRKRAAQMTRRKAC